MEYRNFKIFGKDVQYVYDSANNSSQKNIRNIYIKDKNSGTWIEYKNSIQNYIGYLKMADYAIDGYAAAPIDNTCVIYYNYYKDLEDNKIYTNFSNDSNEYNSTVLLYLDNDGYDNDDFIDEFDSNLSDALDYYYELIYPRSLILTFSQARDRWYEGHYYNNHRPPSYENGDSLRSVIINGTSFDSIQLYDPYTVIFELSALMMSTSLIGFYKATEDERPIAMGEMPVFDANTLEYELSNDFFMHSSYFNFAWEPEINYQTGSNQNLGVYFGDHESYFDRLGGLLAELDNNNAFVSGGGYILIRLEDLLREYLQTEYYDTENIINNIEGCIQTELIPRLQDLNLSNPLRIVLKSDILLPDLNSINIPEQLYYTLSDLYPYLADLIIIEPKLPLSLSPENIELINNLPNNVNNSLLSNDEFSIAFEHVKDILNADDEYNYGLYFDSNDHKIKTVLTNYRVYRVENLQ